MRIPPVKRLQFLGSILMLLGLCTTGKAQVLIILAGSMLILAAMLTRMYLIHTLFRIPPSNNLLNYVLIPMSAFLLVDSLFGYQPAEIPPGMWYYILIWFSAVMGISLFLHSITRRLLALPWRDSNPK